MSQLTDQGRRYLPKYRYGKYYQLRAPPPPQPAPLTDVDPPVFLSTTFPHPLNEVSPDWAARLPPPEALRHGVPAGTVPWPRPVPARALPEMLVLNAEVGQRGVDAETLDYERFGQHIWRDDSGKFIGLENCHRKIGYRVSFSLINS
jgi:hypothetical protein